MTTASTITESEFGYVADLVRREAAIILERGKEYLVEARLLPIAKSEGFDCLSRMLDSFRTSPQPALKKKIIDALTTNETSFMRDIEPFEAMKNSLVRELMRKRSEKRSLSIWSGAASSGQETYSICMILREHFPELHGWEVKILATDINTRCLDKARLGEYTSFEVGRGLPDHYRRKYMEDVGGKWKVRKELLAMAEFKELNLIHELPPMPLFDFIFLRNVLIYFDLETKRSILHRIKKVLHPDGILFLGAAETTLNVVDCFERRQVGKTSVYRLRG